MKHYQYLKYIMRHKWFVFVAGTKVSCNLWRLLTHDLSKLLPSEWFPYVEYFYGSQQCYQYVDDDFDKAWLKHQHRNKHHWQYWILKRDDGSICLITMPKKYIREMVADWAGAGKAITGKWEVVEWYLKNASEIKICRDTRREVELILTDVFGMDAKIRASVEDI